MKIRIILQIIPILTFILSRQIHHLKFHKSLATYKFILQAAPFFVWGFSSSQGIYYTSQTLERFSTFEWKSFSEKNPCHHCSEFWDRSKPLCSLRCYCFTTTKGAENWSLAVHVRPVGFERCTAIFGVSFAGLFWALQAPCGVASNWKHRHGSTPQIYTTLDHILAHLLVSPLPTINMQFYRVDQTVLYIDWSLLGCCGQFRRPLWRILLHIYWWKHQ